jgi:hypothetical protein
VRDRLCFAALPRSAVALEAGTEALVQRLGA